jgi:serine phosphatase RsbU (regulator of sigma subunit)
VRDAQQKVGTSEEINETVIKEVTSYLGTNHAVDDMSIVTIRKN